jgi:ABC-type oligopeptide transport system ATPase subunit
MTISGTAFKNVANRLLDLHDGRILEPGKERKLTAAEQQLPHNRQLIEEGQLVEAQHAHKPTAEKATKTKKESD